MSKTTKQTPKSQLFAEIVARQTQVAAIEAKERKILALKQKQVRLEVERALLVAIDNYLSLGPLIGSLDEFTVTHCLASAGALLERIVKEQCHA
jgi:hypothetical protein